MSEKISAVDKWYDENIIEDEELMQGIGEYALQHIYNCFRIKFKDYKRPIALYAVVFDVIREVLKDMEKTKESFSINIANRMEIGFTSSFDDGNDVEKEGNFMIFITQVPNMATSENKDDSETQSVVLCTEWNASNISEDVKSLKEIAVLAKQRLDTALNMTFDSIEVIFPLFCATHESIVNYLKGVKSMENSFELFVNVANIYDISIMSMEDGEQITIKPKVYDKITFKDDHGASSGKE